MLRKIILMICIAFIVVCYGYPCLILPFGSYKCEYTEPISGETVEQTIQFKFNGRVKMGDEEEEAYYKLSGNEVIVSEDEDFDDSDLTIKLNNIYSFNLALLPGISMDFKNNIGMYAAIGIGALSIILILTAPNKKY